MVMTAGAMFRKLLALHSGLGWRIMSKLFRVDSDAHS